MSRAMLIFACCIVLAACATEQPKVTWTRGDGRPVVPGLLDIAQTDCRDQAKKPDLSDDIGMPKLAPAQPKANQFADCMVQHGYLAAK
jgi:hypothetical protein